MAHLARMRWQLAHLGSMSCWFSLGVPCTAAVPSPSHQQSHSSGCRRHFETPVTATAQLQGTHAWQWKLSCQAVLSSIAVCRGLTWLLAIPLPAEAAQAARGDQGAQGGEPEEVPGDAENQQPRDAQAHDGQQEGPQEAGHRGRCEGLEVRAVVLHMCPRQLCRFACRVRHTNVARGQASQEGSCRLVTASC